ncbi:MAG: DUF11 domain-containing protein [Verrucomicrobiae bacterium]|nr:DUF11 domain-containing protein [Verrucomicrobiae bacterium]
MNRLTHWWAGFALAALFLGTSAAQAQQHRATRLGHPSTRFAAPLKTSDDLRARFRNAKLKPDFILVLRQVNWPGDPEDMFRAAATGKVVEIQIPVGTVMPFMSSRENGRPVALRQVLWAGNAPVEAYEFFFASRGRRYRCVTPKPCSNFYVEDLGPEPPKIAVQKFLPAEASLCDPIEVRVTVRNTGAVPVTGIHILDTLPAGFRLRDQRTSLDMDAGSLQPGEGRELKFAMFASTPGTYVNEARVVTAEGVTGTATATTKILAPALALDCAAPSFVLLGRPIEVCLSVSNTGEAPEPKPVLTLPVPSGATLSSASDNGAISGEEIVWELPALAPGESRKVCATFAPRSETGSLTFAGGIRGECASPAASSCTTEIRGVPGILMEVVDETDPIQVGEEVTYQITIINQGSTEGTNLQLTCLLPPAQEFVSATGVTPGTATERTIRFEPLAILSPKQSVQWQVTIRALQRADARFRTEVITDQFDRPIIEMESTHQY